MADIWYATSRDGFRWEERGPAVVRGEPGTFDDRAVFTPDILVHGGNYYLYYQVIQGVWKHRSIHQIGMAWAHTPDGPWTRPSSLFCARGRRGTFVGDADNADAIDSFGDWDSHKLHDPYVPGLPRTDLAFLQGRAIRPAAIAMTLAAPGRRHRR